MITNIKYLKKCCTDYKNIENYAEALSSPLRYDLHHRLEISEMQSVSDLKFLHLYYHRPPEELIFLAHGEHVRLHNANRSDETRQKISIANKGKHLSDETRQKISESCKGENNPNFCKPGTCLGKHWHIENGKHVYTD